MKRAKMLAALIAALVLSAAAFGLTALAAEHGYNGDKTDYYRYAGGKLEIAAGAPKTSPGYQKMAYANALLDGAGEISFALTFPNANISDAVFFGFFKQADVTASACWQSAKISFGLSSNKFTLVKHGNRTAIRDEAKDSPLMGANVTLGLAGTSRVRMVYTDAGMLDVYVTPEGSAERQIGHYEKLLSQELANGGCYLGFSFYRAGLAYSISDLLIRDGAGEILLADDFTLLDDSTFFTLSEGVRSELSEGGFAVTDGALKKLLRVTAPVLGDTEAGTPVDLTPALFGTGNLTVSVTKEGGDPVSLSPVSGKYEYIFPEEGSYTVNYLYADGDDAANAASAALAVTAGEAAEPLEVTLPSVWEAETGAEIDLTPTAAGVPAGAEWTVTAGDPPEAVLPAGGRYLKTFAEQGYYTVNYALGRAGESALYEGSMEIRVRDAQTQTYLSVNRNATYNLLNHMSFVSAPLSGAVSAEMEVRLGATGFGDMMGIGLYPAYTQPNYAVSGYRTLQMSGNAWKLFDRAPTGAVTTPVVNAGKYADGAGANNAYNFYNRLSVKLEVNAEGDLSVYVKCTEEEALYKGATPYAEIPKDYVLLHTEEGWYAELLGGGDFYFGWGITSSRLTAEDVNLYSVVIKDGRGEILFADNFSDFNEQSGKYFLSNPVKSALAEGRLEVHEGERMVLPYLSTAGVRTLGYAGEEFDLTPAISGLAAGATLALDVQDADGELLSPARGNVYRFDRQGKYTAAYSATDGETTVTGQAVIRVKNASDQPSAEASFAADWNADRFVAEGAAVSDGALLLSAESGKAYFLTKGYSENFILTFDLLSLSPDCAFRLVFGRADGAEYAVELSGARAVFASEGSETAVELGKDLGAALAQGKSVTLRLTVLGGKAQLAAIVAGEPVELLETPLATFADIAYVGRVGAEAEGGTAKIDALQFVSLTDAHEDNTTTEVPSDPSDGEEEEGGNGDGASENKSGCGGCKKTSAAGMGLLAVAAGAALLMRKR